MCSAGTVGGHRPNTSSPARSGAQTTTAAPAGHCWLSVALIVATVRGAIAAMTGRVLRPLPKALQRKPRGSPRCVMETFDSVNGPFLGRCLCPQCTMSRSGPQGQPSGCTEPASAEKTSGDSASTGTLSLIELYYPQVVVDSIRLGRISPGDYLNIWGQRPDHPSS
jgi:hypothetical protein